MITLDQSCPGCDLPLDHCRYIQRGSDPRQHPAAPPRPRRTPLGKRHHKRPRPGRDATTAPMARRPAPAPPRSSRRPPPGRPAANQHHRAAADAPLSPVPGREGPGVRGSHTMARLAAVQAITEARSKLPAPHRITNWQKRHTRITACALALASGLQAPGIRPQQSRNKTARA
jgi:hypothetical protein